MLILIIAGIAVLAIISVTLTACYAIYKAGKEMENGEGTKTEERR